MLLSGWRTVTPSPGGASAAGGATPCSVSQRGRYSPAILPCGHHSGAPSASPRPRQAARAAADEQPAVDHRLAGVGRVLGAGQPRDRGGRAARLVRRQAAELDRRDDAVARRPRALAALDPPVVARDG